MCAALAIVALAGCGSDRPDADAGGGAPVGGDTAPEGPPSVGAGEGTARAREPDRLGRRLSRVCARVQARLEELPQPEGELPIVETNAAKEVEVLAALHETLAAVAVDAPRKAARKAYLRALAHEIDVDQLVQEAAHARDHAAVRALVAQNVNNRNRRDDARIELRAPRCEPGPTGTD
jgi:hypothetical protein